MAYTKIIFQNSPSTATPLNAENLNHMDDQIALNDQRLTDIEGAHVSSFNGRTGAVTPTDGDYNIGQIAPLAGATVGQVPVVVNVGTEEDPELEFAMGQGGGGGHVIVDQSGNALDQESNMTFLDAHLSDNSTDESTDIEIIQSVSESDWGSVTEDGFYDVDIAGADIGPASDEYVEVVADGVKTNSQLLDELYALVDNDKISTLSYISRGDARFRFSRIVSGYYSFFETYGNTSSDIVDYLNLKSSGSTLSYFQNGTPDDVSGNHPASGTKFTLYYGNKYSVIDLQTTANRCLMPDGSSVQDALTYVIKHCKLRKEITSQHISNGYFIISTSEIMQEVGISNFSNIKNVIVGVHQDSDIQALIANGLPSITSSYLFIPIITSTPSAYYKFDITIICEA